MKTPSETIVVPAADVKKEPESKLVAAVARKPAQKKSRKAVKKAARKVTKRAASKLTKRREFPYQQVLKMWQAGKTLETIARAVGRYQKDADDPLRSFRVSLAVRRLWAIYTLYTRDKVWSTPNFQIFRC